MPTKENILSCRQNPGHPSQQLMKNVMNSGGKIRYYLNRRSAIDKLQLFARAFNRFIVSDQVAKKQSLVADF